VGGYGVGYSPFSNRNVPLPTERKDVRGNNFVTAIRVRKSAGSREVLVEVNDIKTVYPKDRVLSNPPKKVNTEPRFLEKRRKSLFFNGKCVAEIPINPPRPSLPFLGRFK